MSGIRCPQGSLLLAAVATTSGTTTELPPRPPLHTHLAQSTIITLPTVTAPWGNHLGLGTPPLRDNQLAAAGRSDLTARPLGRHWGQNNESQGDTILSAAASL